MGWVVAVLLGIAFLLGQCFSRRTEKETEKEIKRIKDSVAVVDAREKASNARVDSLNDVFRQTDSAKQEAEVKLSLAENELFKSLSRSEQLAEQIRRAKIKRDTIFWLANCDSLADENRNLSLLANSYKSQVDVLRGFHAAEISLKDSIISERENLYAALRQSFDGLTEDYIKTLENMPKKKRFAVGPSAGVGIGNEGKITPFVGITVTWAIIKF